MQSKKVKGHKRKGKVVKTHMRKTKGAGTGNTPVKMTKNTGGDSGSEIAKMGGTKRPAAHPHRVKGSEAAKKHMAKIRAMRGGGTK